MATTSSHDHIPNNFELLFNLEKQIRNEAIAFIRQDKKLLLHLDMIESTMSLLRKIVNLPSDDEDFKVVKMLSIRLFNAFGSSLSLMLTGYFQNGALVMRDKIETLFLLDYFSTYRSKIKEWRFAETKKEKDKFTPIAIRTALDSRDGITTTKRAKQYKMFSELAAHPNMHSQHMLRPEKDGDIFMGPFPSFPNLKASLDEVGKLAVQTGEVIDLFIDGDWQSDGIRVHFREIKYIWMQTFYKKLKTGNS